jgi:hypothetical protein
MKPARHLALLRVAIGQLIGAFSDGDLRRISKPAARALFLVGLAHRTPRLLALSPARKSKIPNRKS